MFLVPQPTQAKPLTLTVLKAKGLKDLGLSGGKQSIFLRVVGGSEVKTSDVFAGASCFMHPVCSACCCCKAAAG